MILLTNPQSLIGRFIQAQLTTQNIPFRTLNQVCPTDYNLLKEAVAGVEKIVLDTPLHPDQLVFEMRLLEMATKAKVKQIIKLSTPAGSLTPHQRAQWLSAHQHWQVEEKLKHGPTGTPAYTILNLNPLMEEVLSRLAATIQRSGQIRLPVGDAPIAFVDEQDVAEAVVHILTTEGHKNKQYTLTGGPALTVAQLAEYIHAATGRAVVHRPMPPKMIEAFWAAQGVPEYQRQHDLALMGLMAAEGTEKISPDLASLLGHPPRTVLDYLPSHRAQFTPEAEEGDAFPPALMVGVIVGALLTILGLWWWLGRGEEEE